MIEVDPDDPAFDNPTKPIGPVYTEDECRALAAEKGWSFKPDGDHMRRVVPSPKPKRIFGVQPVEWLLERGSVVICAGGGGIPTLYTDETVPAGRRLSGVEAVIDKDLASAVLAADLHADALLIITDVDAVYSDWGTPHQNAIRSRHARQPDATRGSPRDRWAPRSSAACQFVESSGGFAAIGSINDAPACSPAPTGTCVVPTPADLAAVT